jgi:hypothetical protein
MHVRSRLTLHPETFYRNLYEEIRKMGMLELRYYNFSSFSNFEIRGVSRTVPRE